MKHYRYFVVLLALMLIIWLVPALVDLLVPDTRSNPFVIYSTMDASFIRFESRDKQMHYVDFRGKEWTKQQCDSLLPAFAFRQLLAEGRMPDSLDGQAVTPKQLQQAAFHFKTSPRQLSKHTTPLYTMLESQSGNVDLTLPPDVFRLTDEGLEFVDCTTLQVNRAKSLSFSREMTKHGFQFPVRLIWGNATTRKDYDNGFLMVDSRNALYQVKMVRGMPSVRFIRFSPTEEVSPTGWKKVFTIEPKDMRLVGMAVTGDNSLYAVPATGLPIKTGIDRYDPAGMLINIVGDMQAWTVTIYTDHDSRYYALNPYTFALLDQAVVPDPEPTGWHRWRKFVLPVRLSFASWRTVDVVPVFNEY